MEQHQLHVIEQSARRLKFGQGEVLQLAQQIAGEPIATLYDLDRRQTDALIVYLDQLQLVGVG